MICKRRHRLTLFLLLLTATAGGKNYDFEFRQMDLRKAITSLARLQNRNVMFSRLVESKPIDISLSDVSPEYAMKLIAENYGYVIVNRANGVVQIMTPAERGPANSNTTVIPLNHVIARDIEPNIRAYIGAQGTLAINEQRNMLILSGPEELVPKVRKLVEELDRETLQVYIQAKVIETSTSYARQLGIQWGPTLQANSTSSTGAVTPGAPSSQNGFAVNAPAGSPTFAATLTNWAAVQAQLTLGETKGKIKVLSSPRITTLNGVAASIDSVDTFNIRTLAPAGSGVATVGGIASVTAGVQLHVTPYIVSSERVRLNINVSKSDTDATQIDGIPGVTSNTANTSLIVDNGQTASIGGLIKHRKNEAHTGVPFFSGLPVIGMLFQNDIRDQEDDEIIIFLTPTIYGEAGDTRSVAETLEENSEAARRVKTLVEGDKSQPVRDPKMAAVSAGAAPAAAESTEAELNPPVPPEIANKPSRREITSQPASAAGLLPPLNPPAKK